MRITTKNDKQMTLIAVLYALLFQVCLFNAENGTDCLSVITFWEAFNPADEIPVGLIKPVAAKQA